MRLIDADKLKEQFAFYKVLFSRDDIINIINKAETVYPATKSNDDLVSRVNEAPSVSTYVNCGECTFKNFTENIIDKVVRIMIDNGISDFDELAKRLTEEDKQ